MNIKKTILILFMVVLTTIIKSTLTADQVEQGNVGFIRLNEYGDVEMAFEYNKVCFLKDHATVEYNLSLEILPDVAEQIKRFLAEQAQALSKQQRIDFCGAANYGIDANSYILYVDEKELQDYSIEELKNKIGFADIVLPVKLVYFAPRIQLFDLEIGTADMVEYIPDVQR